MFEIMERFKNVLLLLIICVFDCTPGFALYVKMEKAGTLSHYITAEEKYNITELRIDGPINGTDLALLRDMAGCDKFRQKTNGKLQLLNLDNALIVKGGSWYVDAYDTKFGTENSTLFAEYAFDWCPKLETIYLPSYITAIGRYVFLWLESLKNVFIPEGVKEIGYGNFTFCEQMTEIELPSTLAGIYTDFYKCTKLKTLSCYAQDAPNCGTHDQFSGGISSKGTLYVPNGYGRNYWNATCWRRIHDIDDCLEVTNTLYVKVGYGGKVKITNWFVENEYPEIEYAGVQNFRISYGSSFTKEIVPNAGYCIDKVWVNGEDITSEVINNIINIENITEATTLDISFRKDDGSTGIIQPRYSEKPKTYERYSVTGRYADKSTKGIVIYNGKKYVQR